MQCPAQRRQVDAQQRRRIGAAFDDGIQRPSQSQSVDRHPLPKFPYCSLILRGSIPDPLPAAGTLVVYMAGTSTKSGGMGALRRSSFIRRQQIANIKPAIRLAEKNGTPLNRFITLNFTHTACDVEAVSLAFADLRERFMRWFRRNQPATQHGAAFVWVAENANDHAAIHWLVHIPDARLADFRARLPVWLAKGTGGITCEDSAINVKLAYTPLGAGKYMMKGIDPAYAAFYRIRPVPQGIVHGKRCGFSQSLGPSACRQARTYHSQMRQDHNRQAQAMHGSGPLPAAHASA